MKEEEYCDVQSLALTRSACKILCGAMFLEDQNKTRLKRIIENLRLIESDLENKVDKHMEAEG